MNRKKVFAVVGCIGSGKSGLLGILSRKYPVRNADEVAQEVLLTKKEELLARYGPEILRSGEPCEKSNCEKSNCEKSNCEELNDGEANFGKTNCAELNKKMLAGILFADSAEAKEERRWVANLINRDVVNRILGYADESAGELPCFAEITAPTPELIRAFDGLIVVVADADTAVERTNDRQSGWSEEMRRRIYEDQRKQIGRCISDFSAFCEFRERCEISENAEVPMLPERCENAEVPMISELCENPEFSVFPELCELPGFFPEIRGIRTASGKPILRLDNSGDIQRLEALAENLIGAIGYLCI